jgi:hypothetical protein
MTACASNNKNKRKQQMIRTQKNILLRGDLLAARQAIAVDNSTNLNTRENTTSLLVKVHF